MTNVKFETFSFSLGLCVCVCYVNPHTHTHMPQKPRPRKSIPTLCACVFKQRTQVFFENLKKERKKKRHSSIRKLHLPSEFLPNCVRKIAVFSKSDTLQNRSTIRFRNSAFYSAPAPFVPRKRTCKYVNKSPTKINDLDTEKSEFIVEIPVIILIVQWRNA
ncbi:hypothetical protein OUZ56_020966 [Daphnia magna]|uniref:Uncharacterized protein n=1 Tax=Daphnia magna TaxID=35525 RepID=A0ABQ9ZFZ5_9CRUS|nr:hypothetical protein OUZ56_020966 [Daphnia magna]